MGILFTMELFYCVLFTSLFTSVLCQRCDCDLSKDVVMEKYKVYLIGFTMLFMFIAIICLSLALYMAMCNKTIFGISITKKQSYVRQESGHGVSVCIYKNTANDTRNNDGSTLTVNSGIVEVGALDEPETPTRIELKDEKKPSLAKKPIIPISPMQKAQMDDIIRQVLQAKRHERGSSNLKELEDLIMPKFGKGDVNVSGSRRISLSLNDLDDEDTHDDLYENLPKNKQENKNPVEINVVNRNSDLKILLENEQELYDTLPRQEVYDTLPRREVYDTLPNPIKCPQTSRDADVENIHVYDCPPRKSWEKRDSNSIVLDQDTEYLLLISKSENGDKTSYINAKTCDTLKSNHQNT